MRVRGHLYLEVQCSYKPRISPLSGVGQVRTAWVISAIMVPLYEEFFGFCWAVHQEPPELEAAEAAFGG